MRYLICFGIATLALGLGGCGGGGTGDLVLEDVTLSDIPNLSRLRSALPGDDAHANYIDEALRPAAAPEPPAP